MMEKYFNTGMTLADLKKPLITLDHAVILPKIGCIGFKESVIKWFESYLSNRKFFVELEFVFSDTGLMNCSAPQ